MGTDEEGQMPSKQPGDSQKKGSGWTGKFDFPEDEGVSGVAPKPSSSAPCCAKDLPWDLEKIFWLISVGLEALLRDLTWLFVSQLNR